MPRSPQSQSEVDAATHAVLSMMGGKPVLPPIWVNQCELVGFDWSSGKTHTCGAEMSVAFCHELSRRLSVGTAVIAKEFVPPWHRYTHLVCWPGTGVFACHLTMRGGRK